MSKALRLAIEDISLRPTILQWHPVYADVNESSPPPPCFREFMEWARCIKANEDCKSSFDSLHNCLKRHN